VLQRQYNKLLSHTAYSLGAGSARNQVWIRRWCEHCFNLLTILKDCWPFIRSKAGEWASIFPKIDLSNTWTHFGSATSMDTRIRTSLSSMKSPRVSLRLTSSSTFLAPSKQAFDPNLWWQIADWEQYSKTKRGSGKTWLNLNPWSYSHSWIPVWSLTVDKAWDFHP